MSKAETSIVAEEEAISKARRLKDKNQPQFKDLGPALNIMLAVQRAI